MASRADTLKIAQADLETIGNHVAKARRWRGGYNYLEDEAAAAVRLLEKTARNIRRAFSINGKE